MRRALLLLVSFLVVAPVPAADDQYLALAKDCESLNTGAACAAAGDYLWSNNGRKLTPCAAGAEIVCIRPNEDRNAAAARIDALAFSHHEKACGLDHADACNKAGAHFAIAAVDAPAKDARALARRAEARFAKGCKLGSRQACSLMGSTGAAR